MRIRGTVITIMLLAAAALLLVASSATSQSTCSASGLAQATITPGLSGYVYAGDMGDESTPLNNVTLCAQSTVPI